MPDNVLTASDLTPVKASDLKPIKGDINLSDLTPIKESDLIPISNPLPTLQTAVESQGVGSFKAPYIDKKSLPKEITTNLNPTVVENTPLPELSPLDTHKVSFDNFLKAQATDLTTQTPIPGVKEDKSQSQLRTAISQYNEGLKTLSLKNPAVYTEDEKKQVGFMNTVKALKQIALTDPSAQNPETREALYKLYGKDYDAAHIQILKNIFEESAATAGKYNMDRQLAHDNPEEPKYIAAMGGDQLNAGDLATANKTFSYLMKEHPDSPYGYQGAALIANKNGHTDRSINFLTEALQKNPNDVSSLNLRASFLGVAGKDREAIEDVNKAIKNAKYGTQDAIDAYQVRSELKRKAGDEAGANADMGIINSMRLSNFNNQVIRPELQDNATKKLNEVKLKVAEDNVDIQGNYTAPIKYTDPNTGEEKELSPDEAKSIINNKNTQSINKEMSSVGTGIHGLTSNPIGYLMKYTAQGIQQTGHGLQEMAVADNPLNPPTSIGEIGHNTLKELSGALDVAMGAGRFIPATAVSFAKFNVGMESAAKIAPKIVEAINNPYGTFGGDAEKNPDLANVVNNVTSLAAILLLHKAGGYVLDKGARKIIGVNSDFSEYKKPDVEADQNIPIEDKKTTVSPITTDKETFIQNGLDEYQKTPAFKAALKSGIIKPDKLIDIHKKTLDLQYEESTKVDIKHGDVEKATAAYKLQNKIPLQDKDIHALSTTLKDATPEEVQAASEKAKETEASKPVEQKPIEAVKGEPETKPTEVPTEKKEDIEGKKNRFEKQIQNLQKSNVEGKNDKKIKAVQDKIDKLPKIIPDLSNIDFNKGNLADVKEGEVSNQDQYDERIAKESENPHEIIQAYERQSEANKDKLSADVKSKAIEDVIGKINEDNFIKHSDKNLIEGKEGAIIKKKYITKKGGNRIDQVAQEASDNLTKGGNDEAVSVEDVVNHILGNKYERKSTPLMNELKAQFKKVTGFDLQPTPFKNLADDAIEESKKQIQQEYEKRTGTTERDEDFWKQSPEEIAAQLGTETEVPKSIKDIREEDPRKYLPKVPVIDMTPDQVSNIHGYFNKPLEDMFMKNGTELLDELVKSGVINQLDANRMMQGDIINPVEIPKLVDKVRSVVDGGMKYQLPEKSQRNLDAIIPHVLGLKDDVKPTKYLQKAIAVVGEFPNERKLSFEKYLDSHNLTDVEKNIARVVADPVSIKTLPRLFDKYVSLVNPDPSQGERAMTMKDALSFIFGGEEEPNEHDFEEQELNSQLHEKQGEQSRVGENDNGNAVGETTGDNRAVPSSEPTGQDTRQKITDTGKKINDKIIGGIPEREDINTLPDNIDVTQNNGLAGIYNGVIRAFHYLRGSDMIGVQHSIGQYTDIYSGDKKATREGLIQTRRYLLKYQPDALEPENMTKVLNHFDRIQIANEPLIRAKYKINDLTNKRDKISQSKTLDEATKKIEVNKLNTQIEGINNTIPELQKNVDNLSYFDEPNIGAQTLHQIISDYHDRISAFSDEMKNVEGLPESVLDMIKESQGSGFLHRSILGFLDPAKELAESESRKEETALFKEGKRGVGEYFEGKATGLWQDISKQWEEKYFKGRAGTTNDLTKSRSRFAAVDEKGNTHTIEFNDDGTISKHTDGKRTPFGSYDNSNNPSLKVIKKNGIVKDEKGNSYSLNSGMTTNIERDTQDTYYKNPLESVFHTYLQMHDLHAMVTFFHSVKNDANIKNFMTVLDDKQMGIIDQINRKYNVVDKNDTKGLLGLVENHNNSLKDVDDGIENKYNKVIDIQSGEKGKTTLNKKELRGAILQAYDLPPDFLEKNKSGTSFNHPIFDNTYFRNDAHSGILNALQTEKPDTNAITKPFMSWFYLSIEGLQHAYNSTYNTAVNMLDYHSVINPKEYAYKPLKKAFEATTKNNELRKFLTANGVNNFSNVPDDYNKSIIDVMRLSMEHSENPEIQNIYKKLIANTTEGIGKGFNKTKKGFNIFSKSVVWGMQDINTYSSILKEASERGLDLDNIDFNNKKHTDILKESIKTTANDYPSYKIRNVEGISYPNWGKADPGRLLSRLFNNKTALIFTNYHISLLKSLDAQRSKTGAGLEQALGQLTAGEKPEYDKDVERQAIDAATRMALILGVGVYAINKLEDKINRKGDQAYHVLQHPGLSSIPHYVDQYMKGDIDKSKLFLDVFVPNPLYIRTYNTFINHKTDFGQPLHTAPEALDYMMNGASIPSMEYQTVGDKVTASLKQRVLPYHDTKTTPATRSITQQLYDYKDYFKPQIKKWSQKLHQRDEDIKAGRPVNPAFDSTGYRTFIDKAYNESGDLLIKYQQFAVNRISQIKHGIFVPKGVDTSLVIEQYNKELDKTNELINERLKANKDTIMRKSSGFLESVRPPVMK